MLPPLVIAAAQPESVPHDVVGNTERHAAAIGASGASVVVFPELSLTGYEFDAGPIEASDNRLRPLVLACREVGAVALVGAPVASDGSKPSIGMLRVDSDGITIGYRKMWLGDEETDRFTPGRRPTVIEVDGWRLGLAICKDTGVEIHADQTAALGIDAYVAGVLEHRRDRHVQPKRARRVAAVHDVWVVVASYAGTAGEGFDRAAGESTIWRPDGSIAARAGPAAGEFVVATLTPILRSGEPQPQF